MFGCFQPIFWSCFFSNAAGAEFVIQILSHLRDTANKKKQFYGELNSVSPKSLSLSHVHTLLCVVCCHWFSLSSEQTKHHQSLLSLKWQPLLKYCVKVLSVVQGRSFFGSTNLCLTVHLSVLLISVWLCEMCHRELLRGGCTHCS